MHNDISMQITAKRRKPSLNDSLIFLLALTPIIYLGWLLSRTAVNSLYMDEWDFVYFLRHFNAHILTFLDFLKQHNESRLTLEYLITVGLGLLTRWDTRWDMWVTFLFACVISVNIYLLGRRSLSRRQALIFWAIANTLIFSTEQAENWTWGMQMVDFMPIMFITTGLLVAFSQKSVTSKFLTCAVLATASMYSYANGQLAWALLLIALVIESRARTRRLGHWIGFWAIVLTANFCFYYDGYKKPRPSPSMLVALKHPIDTMHYFAAFLGASLAEEFHSLGVSTLFGISLLGWLLGFSIYLWRGRERLLRPASIWLLLAGYALASAVVAAVGRVGFGLDQSQDSRYTTFSLYLVVALLYLGGMVINDIYRRGEIVSARVVASLGLAFVLLPQIFTQINGNRDMWMRRHARLTEKACVQLMNISIVAPWMPYPNPHVVIYQARYLDDYGDLSPGLVKGNDISGIARNGDGKSIGYLDRLNQLPNGLWFAQGWAFDIQHHEPPETVILAGENSHGEPRGFAVAIVDIQRPDVAALKHDRAYKGSGWCVPFPATAVPAGTEIISAWAYDPLTGSAYRLIGGIPWKAR